MDRRNFLKQASGYALVAAGAMAGVGQVFASTMPARENNANVFSDNLKHGNDMEHRDLGGMDVSAIGMGCLPMVGLLWREIREKRHDSPYSPGIRPRGYAV